MEKRTLDQICKITGVTCDYWNEFEGKPFRFFCDFSPEANLAHLKKYPIKRYTEIYTAEKYIDAVTPENRERVEKLDQIADALNALAMPGNFSMASFRGFIIEA